ncbi:MAG: hypothetical protein MUP03_06230 [Anaerolineales bacterium]|nr:hypothetical protein [Anaerolineales bacterium]
MQQIPRQAGRAALRGHRSKEGIGTMWRAVPGKPANPFGKCARRGEAGASRMTLELVVTFWQKF